MERAFKIFIVIGIAVWIFLMWEKSQPDPVAQYNAAGERIEDAEVSARCAEFKKPVDAGDDWSLGYAGRIRQIFSGCL